MFFTASDWLTIPHQVVSPTDGKTKTQRGQWVPGVTQQSWSTLQSLGPGLHPAAPPSGGPGRSFPSPFPSQPPGFWAFLHCDVLSPMSVLPAAPWGRLSPSPAQVQSTIIPPPLPEPGRAQGHRASPDTEPGLGAGLGCSSSHSFFHLQRTPEPRLRTAASTPFPPPLPALC